MAKNKVFFVLRANFQQTLIRLRAAARKSDKRSLRVSCQLVSHIRKKELEKTE